MGHSIIGNGFLKAALGVNAVIVCAVQADLYFPSAWR